MPAVTQLVRAEPGWSPIRVTVTPWSPLGALKWTGTPVLRSLPLKVSYPLLAAPHAVDSHKLTVKDFLKSLLHTRRLCPSNPVLFPRQSVLWILCLAWPSYPAALFLMAHKLVLEVIFPVSLLLKELEEAKKEFRLQKHGTLGKKNQRTSRPLPHFADEQSETQRANEFQGQAASERCS